jgi:RNA polymerase sigma-70 factor (ECF subfamily)
VKIFGPENYTLVEDVVQDALLSGLETWKFNGIPDNPEAWLFRVAKNKAIDIIRRNKHQYNIDFSSPEQLPHGAGYTPPSTFDQYWQDQAIRDDFLGMMFACCHPDISPENQVTFILKSLCGFSTREVARAFLTSEDTISKRLYRTKEFFRTCSSMKATAPPGMNSWYGKTLSRRRFICASRCWTMNIPGSRVPVRSWHCSVSMRPASTAGYNPMVQLSRCRGRTAASGTRH